MPSAVFTDANHICIVTADIDRAVRVWSDKYGVGPWQVFSYDSSTMTALVNGEPTAFAIRSPLEKCSVGVELLELRQSPATQGAGWAGQGDWLDR